MNELFLEKIKEFSKDDILNDMDEVYRQMCKIEELPYENAYGFGNEAIKEYICSIILLKFIDFDKKKYIKYAIRLLIIGTFGPINFCDFIEYVCLTKLNIDGKTFKQGLTIIEEKYPTCINSELADKNTKNSSFVDLDEYIYILDNVNYGEKFRKNKTDVKIENENPIIKKVISNEKNKAFKIVVAILCIIALILAVGILYLITTNNHKQSSIKESTSKNIYSQNSTKKQSYDEDKKLKKASSLISNALSDSICETTYCSNNSNKNYVKDKYIKENYFIFYNASGIPDLGDTHNYLVKKSDLSMYYYEGKNGLMFTIEDFNSLDSPVSEFINNYYSGDYAWNNIKIPKIISDYINKNGSENFCYKLQEILNEANPETTEAYTPITYVKLILSGKTKEELDRNKDNPSVFN